MSQAEHKLLGTAARVADLFEGRLRIEGLYGPEGSHLYHNFTLQDEAEVQELLSASAGRSGPVLELCSGSGRLTLPFLRAGYEMVGLDSSPYMTGLLEERLREPENSAYADALTTVAGDMTDFSLDRRFGVVFLGATAIWNLDAAGRASLFRCVRDHLAEDGRFLLTALTFRGLEDATAPLENVSVFATRDSASPVLCTFIDHAEPSGLRCTSIVCQRLQDGAVADTTMYTAWSHLASLSALTEEITAAGLRVVSQEEILSKHQITKNDTKAGRQRWLIEVAR
jgi:SAM-dependent methyltransferase